MEVRVVGSERYPQAKIIAASGLKVGTSVSPSDFKAAANKLAGIGIFSSVRYRYQQLGPGLGVEFEVEDVPKLWACAFSNFVWFSPDELLESLRARVPLFSGEAAAGGSQVEDLRAALQQLLKERGIGGQVVYSFEDKTSGELGALTFQVEGVPIIVREVRLPGATQIDRDTLARLTGGIVDGAYDPALIRRFLAANLTLEYGDKGYLKAVVGGPSTELIKHPGQDTWVSVTVPVKEGPQYRCGLIRWSGDTDYSEGQLAKLLRFKSGDVANQGALEKGLMAIANLYASRGHARAQTKVIPTFDEDQHTVSYEVRIDKGPVYQMGMLTITGLGESATARLGRACLLQPGQLYNRGYWEDYMKSIIRLLPADFLGKPFRIKEDIDDSKKTVNVTISVGAQATP